MEELSENKKHELIQLFRNISQVLQSIGLRYFPALKPVNKKVSAYKAKLHIQYNDVVGKDFSIKNVLSITKEPGLKAV